LDFIIATVHQLLAAELYVEHLVEFLLAVAQQVLAVRTGKTFMVIQAIGFVALQEV
jgi:hypothetical protein